MAYRTSTQVRATARVQFSGSQFYEFERTKTTGLKLVPDKTTGGFITFADGSKFRRSTVHARMESRIDPQQPQFNKGYDEGSTPPGLPWSHETGPGGYTDDDILSSNMSYEAIKLFGMASTFDAPDLDNNMRNEAVTKALNELADQKANIGENLATFRQTLQLVRSPLSTLVKQVNKAYQTKAWRPYLKLEYRELVKLLKDFNGGKGLDGAAAAYLQYAYGWKPLMQDIHGIIELAKESGKKPLLLNGYGVSKQAGQTKRLVFDNYSQNSRTSLGPLQASSKHACSLWASIDPNYSGTRALNQLGLLNPLSLGWDIMPWSFVIDWVLPIGPVLSALTASAGLNFVDGSISNRASANGPYTWRNVFFDHGGYKTLEDREGNGTYSYEGYYRQPVGDWPRPGLWVAHDPFGTGDRPWKALALAILALPSLRR